MYTLPLRTALVTATIGAAVVGDHLFERAADDWTRYDHRAVTVAAVTAGDAVRLADGTPVRLLGITDPAPAATPWLGRRVSGRRVTLLLPAVGTRDPAGRLLAYAYADDGSCLNVSLVHDGLAYADRRGTDALAGLIDAAEADARRKGRGLWDDLRFEQMPPWRQAWLRAKAAKR